VRRDRLGESRQGLVLGPFDVELHVRRLSVADQLVERHHLGRGSSDPQSRADTSRGIEGH
jgi:hypothetical protein